MIYHFCNIIALGTRTIVTSWDVQFLLCKPDILVKQLIINEGLFNISLSGPPVCTVRPLEMHTADAQLISVKLKCTCSHSALSFYLSMHTAVEVHWRV